jgi:hypothetical protein
MSKLNDIDTLIWESYVLHAVPLEELQLNTQYVLLEPSVLWYEDFSRFLSLEHRMALSYSVIHTAEIVYFYGTEVNRYDLSKYYPDKQQELEYQFHPDLPLANTPRELEHKAKWFGYFLESGYTKAWCILPKDKFPTDKLKSRINSKPQSLIYPYS